MDYLNNVYTDLYPQPVLTTNTIMIVCKSQMSLYKLLHKIIKLRNYFYTVHSLEFCEN